MNTPLILKLAEECTTTLTGYDEFRGNYKLPHFDKWLFVQTVVRECVEVVENSEGYENFRHVVDNLKNHFGVDVNVKQYD